MFSFSFLKRKKKHGDLSIFLLSLLFFARHKVFIITDDAKLRWARQPQDKNPSEALQAQVSQEESKASTTQYIPPISSTRLTVHTHLWMLFFYHYYCVIKTFGVLFIKGKEYYPGEKALHLPELITVHFTGNKVCGIHFFVAINQDGNK